jgi:multidrug efflux system membrane fusion protein
MRKTLPLYLLPVACCLLFLPACSRENPRQPQMAGAAPVTVGTVLQKDVPVQIRAIGNVEAYSIVGVKAQVGGELTQIHFREGQYVKKGEPLFTIDPRPYETALKHAEANLARDSAQLDNAKVDAVRYAELVKKGYVAQEQYDQVRTNAAALEATVNADKATVENARLLLKYCYIYSPITGRTGSIIANQGNLIKANADTPIVVINQVQPIYVSFAVPEQDLAEIKKHIAAGKLAVEAFISDNKKPEEGVVTFVDNTVDPATGTITLKATFQNREQGLWPGQFVAVRITLTTIKDAVAVSSAAVQTGQQGQFVFVVKENSAELRPVKTGITHEDVTVIQDGLTPGEQVVTDGQIRLFPGAKVEIKNKQ